MIAHRWKLLWFVICETSVVFTILGWLAHGGTARESEPFLPLFFVGVVGLIIAVIVLHKTAHVLAII